MQICINSENIYLLGETLLAGMAMPQPTSSLAASLSSVRPATCDLSRTETALKRKEKFDEHSLALPDLLPGNSVVLRTPSSGHWEGEGVIV